MPIRLASEEEALLILNEPRNSKRIGKIAESCIYQPWIAEKENKRLLFLFWAVHEKTYEMHIAAPKSDLIMCRFLAKEAMEWVFSMGAEKIITNCPKGKIANMATKLGMKPYNTEGNIIYFEAISWAWVQR